jgi:hypothetical protein
MAASACTWTLAERWQSASVVQQAGFQATIVGSGNIASSTCADTAPPPLPAQCVVPPDLLDSHGGLNAVTNSDPRPEHLRAECESVPQ